MGYEGLSPHSFLSGDVRECFYQPTVVRDRVTAFSILYYYFYRLLTKHYCVMNCLPCLVITGLVLALATIFGALLRTLA